MPETDFHIVPKRPQAAKVVNGTAESVSGDQKASGDSGESRSRVSNW